MSRRPSFLFLVFILVCLVVSLAGWLFYQHSKNDLLEKTKAEMASIASLKIDQIVEWRNDRLKDALVVEESPLNDLCIRPFFENPANAEARRDALAWMNAILAEGRYCEAILADTQGVMRLMAGGDDLAVEDMDSSNVLAVVRSGRTSLPFVHKEGTTDRVRITLYVALRSHDPAAGAACIGVMLLEIEPSSYFFPSIQSWPTPSLTAETSLVKRMGDDVVFLNEMRHRTNTSLMLRFPVSTPDLPVAMAVRGQEGFVEGRDYRGVPVLAVLRRIPGSTWSMVCEMDRSEVVAPVRFRAYVVSGFGLIIAAVAGLAILFWWKRREALFYAHRFAMEKERDRQAEVIREQRQIFELLFERTLGGFWDWNIPSQSLVMSPRCKAVLGYADDEMPNTQEAWQRLVYPDDLPMLFDVFNKHVESRGQVPYNLEVRYVHKNGGIVWVNCVGMVVRWAAAGTPLRMVGCHINIDDRKQAEFSVRESEMRYRMLFSCGNDAIFLYELLEDGSPGPFVEVNDLACQLLGYTREELMTMRARDVRDPDTQPDWKQYFNKLLHETRFTYETVHRTKDGRKIPVEISTGMIRIKGKNLVLGIVRDLTDRKRVEDEMVRAKEAAEAANRAKSEFLANMSHELRTPLNSVIGFSEMLQDQVMGPLNDKQLHYVGNILNAGQHLLSLINDILDLAKVEAGKTMLNRTRLTLKKTVGEVMALAQGKARAHGLQLGATVPESLAVMADERVLKQILFNILSNAMKFTPAGGRISVGAETQGPAVVISVEDSGIGIRKEDQERIFKEFEQVDSSMSRRHQGTGLGLGLCRKFVELHGGRIWVESAGEGCGSVFRFTLPAELQGREHA